MSQEDLMWMLELLSSAFLMKGSMHLSPPMKRYVATLASQGSNLGKERKTLQVNILLCLNASSSIPSVDNGHSRPCEEGDVHQTGDADHLLFGQYGLHGLLHGV